MKRQRKGASAKARSGDKKKAKVVTEAQEDAGEIVAVKERSPEVPTVEEVAEWAGLWSGVDEEMSWATSWCPLWEIMEGNSDAYDALYDDVLWDYDIWGFNTAASPPNP